MSSSSSTLDERRAFHRKTDVKNPVTNIDFNHHTLTGLMVEDHEVLVQSSRDWSGVKEGQYHRLQTDTRNTWYCFFGTATRISMMNLCDYLLDDERNRRTFYRTPPGGVEEYWYLDPASIHVPIQVRGSTVSNFNFLNRLKSVEQEEDANMWVEFWDEFAVFEAHEKDKTLRTFLQSLLDKSEFDEEQLVLVGISDTRVRGPCIRTFYQLSVEERRYAEEQAEADRNFDAELNASSSE